MTATETLYLACGLFYVAGILTAVVGIAVAVIIHRMRNM